MVFQCVCRVWLMGIWVYTCCNAINGWMRGCKLHKLHVSNARAHKSRRALSYFLASERLKVRRERVVKSSTSVYIQRKQLGTTTLNFNQKAVCMPLIRTSCIFPLLAWLYRIRSDTNAENESELRAQRKKMWQNPIFTK